MRRPVASSSWAALGLVGILTAVVAQAALGVRFFPGATLASAPVLTVTFLQFAAGLLFALTLFFLRRVAGFRWLAAVLVCGLLIRGAFILAHPILETDFNRYLWDGAVVQSGENPWQHAPQSALDGTASPTLNTLGVEAGIVLKRVNHPELTTIYPPGAQLFFSISASLGRFNLDVWRIVLLLCELATLAILLKTLSTLRLPLLWIACWWINPLLAREASNTAHMDALLLPWIAAALYCITAQRNRLALAFVAIATSIKLWPALLSAWVFRKNARGWWFWSAAAASLFIGLAVAPMLLTDRGPGSGLLAYSARWDTNGGIFSVLRDFFSALSNDTTAQLLARVTVVGLLGGWLLGILRREASDAHGQLAQIYSALMALLLLSPAGYPWYALWLAPVAVLVPRWSFVVVTIVFPFYYLRFFFEHQGNPWLFHHVIPVVEAACVLLVIWFDYRGRLPRWPTATRELT